MSDLHKHLVHYERVVIVLVVMLMLIPVSAFTAEKAMLEQLINADEMKSVLEGKILTSVYLKNHEIYSNHLQDDSTRVIKPANSESIDYSAYEMVAVEKAFIPFDLESEDFLSLYNRLTAFSRLAGISYHSQTDQKLQPYIIHSYLVESPENDVAVDDKIHKAVPADYTAYFRIKDNRFGKLLMRSHVSTQNNNIIIKNRTLQPMTRFLIKINDAGEYEQQVFFLYDSYSRGFYYYAMQVMRIRSEFFLKLSQLTPSNFANRVRALTVYFAGVFGHDWQDRLVPVP